MIATLHHASRPSRLSLYLMRSAGARARNALEVELTGTVGTFLKNVMEIKSPITVGNQAVGPVT